MSSLQKERKDKEIEKVLEKITTVDIQDNIAKNNYKELIQNIIEESYTDSQFTLSVLSEKLDLSSGYLSIMFKKNFGIPFQDYLLQKRMEIYIMGIIFVALVLVIAKKNGLKALFALIVTVAFIVKVFIPAVFNGYSPILFAVITAIFSSLVTIYYTVGMNKKFFVSLFGVIGGVVVAGMLSYIFTYRMRLNGYLDPELLASASILKNINLKEVIPAGVIIGSLGAVMDVAVSIASSINELHITDPNMSQKAMFKSVINIGTDIIGPMINTLILAYIASSVFTLLLVYAQAGEYPIIRLLNFQDIAVEIMRSVCGSIGILISVPLTAYIGTLIYKQK